jgi:hypothetical protein
MDMTDVVHKYHHLDYEVMIHKNQHREAQEWCEKQFGRRWEAIGYMSGVWSVFWAGRSDFDQYRFCFAKERDMILFILRWV